MIFNSLFGLPMISSLTSLLFKVFCAFLFIKMPRNAMTKCGFMDDFSRHIWFDTNDYLCYFRFHRDKEFVLCPHCGKLVSKNIQFVCIANSL